VATAGSERATRGTTTMDYWTALIVGGRCHPGIADDV